MDKLTLMVECAQYQHPVIIARVAGPARYYHPGCVGNTPWMWRDTIAEVCEASSWHRCDFCGHRFGPWTP